MGGKGLCDGMRYGDRYIRKTIGGILLHGTQCNYMVQLQRNIQGTKLTYSTSVTLHVSNPATFYTNIRSVIHIFQILFLFLSLKRFYILIIFQNMHHYERSQ